MRNSTDRPNVILINCDDLGYGDLACYGSEVNRTPHLDDLAARGVRFTDFYMASSVCTPSRGAMLTGCYPKRIGFGVFQEKHWVLFPGMAEGLHTSEKTIASVLKQQDYATMLVGKWHCGDQPEFLPTEHGFDDYYGIPYSNDMGRQRWPWGDRGSSGYPPLPLISGDSVIEEQPEQEGLTERYAERSVQFIRDHQDEPFFLYLAHMHVHRPVLVANRFVKSSQNGPYGAAVEAIDWVTGVLVHELRRLGIEENTMVVFTSDNGSKGSEGGSNAPLRGGKGSCWEGGFRLPLIVAWPGQIEAGQTCEQVATSMDFLPTFAGLAGADVPDDRILDGKDIAPLLNDPQGATSPHEAFFYYQTDCLNAVRAGEWKLHVFRPTGCGEPSEAVLELYNLKQDIAESNNLAAERPEIVAQLQAHLVRMRDDLGDLATDQPGANCRPVGVAANPKPLTEFDPDYPYICAEYDTDEAG